jgi:hypothetical protein
MTTTQWIRFAIEVAVDLVTGRLDGPGKPSEPRAPTPTHLDVEHMRRASHGHMVSEGTRSFWCRGPHDPEPDCARCRATGKPRRGPSR